MICPRTRKYSIPQTCQKARHLSATVRGSWFKTSKNRKRSLSEKIQSMPRFLVRMGCVRAAGTVHQASRGPEQLHFRELIARHQCHRWIKARNTQRNTARPKMDTINAWIPSHCPSQSGVHFQHQDGSIAQARPAALPKIAAKPRTVLTKADVIAIFQIKATLPSTTKVAKCYGVSEKTIRDVWTRRTWAAETWHLDPSSTLDMRQPGRPLGSRDSKPRKQRQLSANSSPSLQVSCFAQDAACGPVHDDQILFDDQNLFDVLEGWVCDEQVIFLESACADGSDGIHADWCAPSKSIDDELYEWEQGQGRQADFWSDPFHEGLPL